jgi:ferric-dicitrate binding protein FerR (iron transport regulator)
MEEDKHIGRHIVEYLCEGGGNDMNDTVLMEWMAVSESNRAALKRYERIWKESRCYMEKEAFDTEFAWRKINELNRRKVSFRKRLMKTGYAISGVAATWLLWIVLSYTGFSGKNPAACVSMTTGKGSRSEIVLPDGSTVKLNSGSTIRYSFDRTTNMRRVDFQGEGFFDVEKSRYPFVVNMENGLQMKVLGTTFNLCAYTGDQTIRASLVEGAVELIHSSGKLNLTTGEMAVYDRETNELKAEEGVLSHTYGWLNEKLYMDNMSLSDVCRKLERYYDVQITLHGNIGETIHYNGVLQEESLADVLDVLCRLSKIKYQVNGKNIRITSN